MSKSVSQVKTGVHPSIVNLAETTRTQLSRVGKLPVDDLDTLVLSKNPFPRGNTDSEYIAATKEMVAQCRDYLERIGILAYDNDNSKQMAYLATGN